MTTTTQKMPQGMLKLAISVDVSEIKADLDHAAQILSEQRPIEGYRPGKAPYDIVKMRFGEMAIYEAALTDILRRNYVKAVIEQKLKTFGEPKINVTKLSPGNPIEFTAEVVLIPEVISLHDFRTVKVEEKSHVVEDKQLDEALKELSRMQTREQRVSREAGDKDKIVVDMDLTVDKVPVEGGQARNHGIYLEEEYYVPGFKAQVIGMKEGEKKSFTLKFPAEHYQKNLAGRDVGFEVTLKEVHEMTPPTIDDAFAKTIGQESLEGLRTILRRNLQEEADEKEQQRVEVEILEAIVEKSRFEDIPDAIINAEVERMIDELRDSVTRRGMELEAYLENIKKTLAELKLEFTAQAIKRIKTALVVRTIAEKEHIEVSDADVLAEQQKLINAYVNEPESQAMVRTDDYQDYLRTTLANRLVLELLRKSATGK